MSDLRRDQARRRKVCPLSTEWVHLARHEQEMSTTLTSNPNRDRRPEIDINLSKPSDNQYIYWLHGMPKREIERWAQTGYGTLDFSGVTSKSHPNLPRALPCTQHLEDSKSVIQKALEKNPFSTFLGRLETRVGPDSKTEQPSEEQRKAACTHLLQ